MELFIRIVNGQPFEHPIFGDNFRQAFPEVDTENLPSEFARFIKVTPTPAEFEVPVGSTYVWSGAAVTEVWTYAPMSQWQQDLFARGKIDAAGSAPNVVG